MPVARLLLGFEAERNVLVLRARGVDSRRRVPGGVPARFSAWYGCRIRQNGAICLGRFANKSLTLEAPAAGLCSLCGVGGVGGRRRRIRGGGDWSAGTLCGLRHKLLKQLADAHGGVLGRT
jgi:hypothetical protein